jgi:hypothetical protein
MPSNGMPMSKSAGSQSGAPSSNTLSVRRRRCRGLAYAQRGGGGIKAMNFGVNLLLADAPLNELRVLRAKSRIENSQESCCMKFLNYPTSVTAESYFIRRDGCKFPMV